MISLPNRLQKTFNETYEAIKDGRLKTLIPLLSLFELNGKPMNLQNHFQLAPMFSVVQPQQLLMMLSRQNGKSVSICGVSGLRSMLIPNYHQVIVQPQFEMIKRLNNTIYQPLMRSCPVINSFISSVELSKMTLKVFKNNSMTFMEHAYISPDRLRGISGASSVTVDETIFEETPIYLIDKASGDLKVVPIKDSRAGDFILSCNFFDGSVTVSVVTKDASFHGYRNYFTVTTKTGRSLTCTADHVLPTNHGPMRMGDIIEYVYSSSSIRDRHVRGTSQCNHGESSRGRKPQEQREDNQGSTLESRPGTGRLRDSQVRNLTRVRYTSTVSERESRLRRLLGSAVSKGPSDLSLYVHPAPARRLGEENRNVGILGRDNSSDSSSLVVHGRREPEQRSQHRGHIHQRIQRARGGVALSVVEYSLGSGIEALYGETQQHRKLQPYHLPDQQGVCGPNGTHISICAGMHAVQSSSCYKAVQELWPGLHCGRSNLLLFQGMQGKLSESTQARVLSVISSGTPGRASGSRCCIQGSAQRGNPAEGARISGKYDRGAEGTSHSTATGLAESKSRPYKRSTQGLSEAHEGRSGVRGETEGGADRILSTQGSGSREACAYAGTGEDAQKTPGSESTGTGIPEETPCAEDHKRSDGGSEACSMETLPCYSIEAGNRGAETGVLLSVCAGASRISSGGNTIRSEGMGNVPADAEREGEFFLDPVVKIEYAGVLPGYDIEVEGTHNYVLANGILSKNCQDMNWEFIPIIEECMSASINWGFSIYTGTPKTTDNTLSLLWNRSSQAEWVIKCDACGFFNIPNPEQHLTNMIGKHGPICAKCGRPLIIEHGGWVHGYPDRSLTFPGYHLAQPCHKLHSINDLKWGRLVHKIETLPTVTLFNEVYGWPYDDATSPLTLSDLINAEFDPIDQYGTKVTIKTPADVRKVEHNYSYISIGCDWGGGSAISDSFTAFAVVGLRVDNQVMDVLYYERIPKGVSPTDEAKILMSWIAGTKANAFTFDNGGAGFVRTEIMKQEGLSNIDGLQIIPQQYGPPRGGDVMRLAKAQRETDMTYYVTDKSRSLAMCVAGIKAKRIRIPHFVHDDENDPIRDLLALIEDPRDIRGRDVVILIGRKAGRPDDLAHAINFACTQIGDAFGAYLPIGRRYDTSKLEPLMDDEIEQVYGPRGDFERFQDAISDNATVITPYDEEYYY